MLPLVFIALGIATVFGVYVEMKKQQTSTVPDSSNDNGATEATSEVVGSEAEAQAIASTSGIKTYTPTQDKVKAFAEAIAYAEGFGKPGAIPTRSHNPGDLRPPNGVVNFWTGQVGIDAGHAVFVDDNAGWLALYRQVTLMAENKSNFYDLTMSIAQVGKIYAESDTNASGVGPWAKNVCSKLGISPSILLGEFFYGQESSNAIGGGGGSAF